MENKLTKKYGLFTAICMVVGIVIGSGIFFKAQDVLKATAGDALMGVLAWAIGGAIMAVLAVTFGIMATKYEKVGGIVDYAESTCGKTYAYFLGWFVSVIYYPAMTAVLAWVSARYTLVALGYFDAPTAFLPEEGLVSAFDCPECMVLAALYLIVIYFMNAIAPSLSGKFQVSTTVIKLIPIAFIAIVGTIIGLASGNLAENVGFATGAAGSDFAGGATVGEGNLFTAICCTVFAFEGWIIATSINAEIKDAKKNLPIALGLGAAIIAGAYILYYVGILGLTDMNSLGTNGTSAAYSAAFGTAGAAIINVLVIVSCLGTLNGLMLGCTRGFYALAARGEGISPDTLGQVDKKTNMPHNSASLALFICILWLAYFVGSQFFGWFGEYAFDSSELPVVTVYPMYIPIIIAFAKKSKELHPVKRFVLPALSTIGAGIVVAASIVSHGIENVWYLILFTAIMGIGAIFYRWDGSSSPMDKLLARLVKGKPAADAVAEPAEDTE